jgi:hypothetical protein
MTTTKATAAGRIRESSTASAAKTAKQINSPQLTALASTAWHTAYTSLWNCTQFSTTEIDTAKRAIMNFLQLHSTPEKGFIVFCQRVVLARFEDNILFPVKEWLPSQWFDRRIANGFTWTKERYDGIEKQRAALPLYKQGLKAFAEAVLEFSQEPTVRNYKYWRQYFIDRNKPELLELFQRVCVQQICGA